jgi:L-ribulose-5-phosphate 4-epimerase
MDMNTAKQQVIDAGKRLVAQGLISRTWGNVSCRIDDKSFVITPSGKPYDTLTPEQIVLLDIETLAYDGDVKPSGEKGVHAEVYKARPEVNFVIHTHQTNASVLSALHSDIRYIPADAAKIIGTNVPYAGYGLPGTKTLIAGVASALKRPKIKALLMAHHGALCFGEDSEKAFEAAMVLEDVCALQVYTQFKKIYGTDINDMEQFAVLIAEKEFGAKELAAQKDTGCKSFRQGGDFILSFADPDKKPVTVSLAAGKTAGSALPAQAALHRAVYLKKPEINCIIQSPTPALSAVSHSGKALKPQVDDFAQIVGADARCAVFDPKDAEKSAARCVKAMKGRHGLLLKGNGALCCGPDESDAAAVEMIMEKNSLAFLGTILFNVYRPISASHSYLMRFVYLKKYSKQAK